MKTNDVGVFNVAVCAIILNDKNEVLITQRNFTRSHHPGEWEVPTGRLDQGEDFVTALHRELMEELKIKVLPLIPINTFHFYRGPEKAEHVGVSYLCRFKSGPVIVDGVEEIAYQWVSLSKAQKIVKDVSIVKDFALAKKYLVLNTKL